MIQHSINLRNKNDEKDGEQTNDSTVVLVGDIEYENES